ncbi:MAG: SGNH/GDSL hydrolase family protein [Clostridia bacterium]|nr:SGNH/GDSL hydrolase family protein [Clostridia bacterium]
MKKVLLLGDSIRMGYDDYVKEILQGKCEVCYDADHNGRFSAYTLWQMNQMFRYHGPFDVVHWNNGYWDMNVEAPMVDAMHPVEEYVHFLKRILGEIRRNGARPIFATTTPVLSAGSAADIAGTGALSIQYDNDWVKQYNQAARELMAAEGVPVNDLYALCKKDPYCYKCPDLLHLTEEGYRKCAQQTAEIILRELGMA